jgi:hypothetical protein
MSDGYTKTYRELIETTDWSKYGRGNDPRCDNCMAHCGFEGTAVNDAFSRPVKALLTSMRGPRVSGPMAPELPFLYPEGGRLASVTAIPVSEIKRASPRP